MAEELRLFLRTAVYIAGAGAVYWLLSYEPAGTVLLVALLLALLAFVGAAATFAPRFSLRLGGGGALGWVNRLIGFHERTDARSPLEGRDELVPLASPWPIVTAAAAVVMGLGTIFGPWLLAPGLALLVFALVGWLTQLERR